MSCRKGFRAFDTSDGWPIGNVKSCCPFAAFWPKRRYRRPALLTSRFLKNVRSARGQCALLNALPLDRFAIRQRSQSPFLWILLSEASNTATCMLLWACIAQVCFHQNDDPFFHVWEEAELNNGPFDLNSKVHFRQTYTWFLPTTTHSAIEYP